MTQQLGKYKIITPLGEGATAFVYHARDTQLKRDVALKVLKPALVADGIVFERFMYEAQAAANLFHPHIATVFDMGESDGRYYIAMQYISGKSLDKILEDRHLSWEEAQKLASQIGDALDFAHSKDFIHRDIKPSNIILDLDGNFWLTDFGLTKAMMSTGLTSHTGAVLGTPAYIAPEIWQGQAAQSATDQYALACVVFEALTGKILFSGDTPPATMKRHFDPLDLPPSWPEDVPDGINAVLDKALTKEPEERYASARELVAALNELGQEPEIVEPEVISEPEVTAARPALKPEPVKEPSNIQLANVPTPSWWKRWQFWVFSAGAVGFISLCVFVVYTLLRLFYPELINNVVVSETHLPSETTVSVLGVGSTQQSDVDGMMMVYVPAGDFEMGSVNGDDDEKPLHRVYLGDFWIDQTEVTNTMYARFLNEIGNQSEEMETWIDVGDENVLIVQSDGEWQPKSGYGNHPVIEVSWYGAQAYCEWAGRHLPTEAEWEKAARGGQEGAKYAWGSDTPICTPGATNGAKHDQCADQTVQVGTFSPNGFGLYDMAGNVWEWVADWYGEDYYANSPYQNPSGPRSGEYRTLRGGSWFDEGKNLRSSVRFRFNPVGTRFNIGFRCALAVTTAPTALYTTPAPLLPNIETSQPPSPTASQLGIGSTQKSDVDSMVQVYVPAGEFEMGSNAYDNEKPIHTVYLDAFWIDQTEVTNAQYEQCVSDGACGTPWGSHYTNSQYSNHPVVYVDWNESVKYCEWAGRRLPTEAEWEKAARGEDGRTYPWGEGIDCDRANYHGCVHDTSAVGSYPAGASPYDVLDMAGNVLEWVADWYADDYYENSSGDNPKGPESGDHHVERGGSWGDLGRVVRSANRFLYPPGYYSNELGFRCAMDADQ